MPGYGIKLESFTATRPRARDTDSDHIHLGVAVNKANFTEPEQQCYTFVDKVGGGSTHNLGLEALVVAVPGSAVQIAYQIANSGFDRSTEAGVKNVMNKMSDGAAQLCKGYFGFAVVWDALNKFTHWLNDLFIGNCDGMVVGDAIEVPEATLASWTNGGQVHREIRNYPGTPSPVLCGEESLYHVTWSIRALSPAETARIQRGAM